MNREQRRAEHSKQTRGNKARPLSQRREPSSATKTNSIMRHTMLLRAVALLVLLGTFLSLWNAKATSDTMIAWVATPAPSVSTSSYTSAVPTSTVAASCLSGISSMAKISNPAVSDKTLPTIVGVKSTSSLLDSSAVTAPHPILEADIQFDLSESNGGHTFDLGRIAPCSQVVFRADGSFTTVGNLKVGARIHLSDGAVGRVVHISKKWHTPTLSKPDANGNTVDRVIATTKRLTNQILYLYTSAEMVKTTPEHPFAVKGKGFVKAGLLKQGDILETQDGTLVSVERAETRYEPQLVYNLEVEHAHNFFVGKSRLLVHNGGPCTPTFLASI